jgi:hypothetical protein
MIMLNGFRRVRRIAKNDCQLRHVCLSAWNNSVPTQPIFMKFDIRVFFFKLWQGNFITFDKNIGMIWGFRREWNEFFRLLGCYVA